jgi:hypothetical protein
MTPPKCTMSKTLINFLQYSELPTKNELENKIRAFGYNFKFVSEFEKFDNLNQIDFIECKLNGQQVFVQIHHSPAIEILANITYLKEELTHKDCAISFPFSSNKIVHASVHIISLGLIELCQSKALYAHERIFYTREMLIKNISNLYKSNVVEKYNNPKNTLLNSFKSDKKRKNRNENIKIFIVWGILFLVTLFMKKGIISWATPLILFILITTPNQIYAQKRKSLKNKDETLK